MNFFEHQDKANKKTGRLIILFFLGLVLTIVAANAIIYGALIFAGLDNPIILEILEEPLWLYVTLGFIMVMGLGTVIKLIQISSGGLSIAKMVDGRPLSEGTQSFEEQQFVNVVEEMAIASGTPVPQLFVMHEESINAFVAGTKMDDTVMVVTTGALQALNREELQAVVGHEFSHIFNGDMKISLKLMGVLGGLLMIGKVGYVILRMRPMGRSSSSRKGNGVFVIILIGIGLMIVGYMGLFFGRMMKAAVSRQRELLADACSVQYTRNPRGLASAFRVMQSHQAGTHLQTKSAEDISHMCFGPSQWMMFSSLLATHPPLEDRIKAIDPSDQYGILPRRKADEPEASHPKQTGLDDLLPLAAGAVLDVTPQAVEATIAMPGDNHVAYAMALMATIPNTLRMAVRDSSQIESIVLAMLTFKQENPEKIQACLEKHVDKEMQQQIDNIQAQLDLMDAASYLPLFDLALGAFNQLDEKEKQAIYAKALLVLDEIEGAPFHFALLTILHNQIKANQTSKQTIHKLEPVLKEITYILAVLLSCSQLPYEEQKDCFIKQMAKITKRKIAYPKLDSIKYSIMVKMLTRLNQVSPLGKEQIIKACIHCVLSDNKVLVAEGELLRAICEALNCPIPPIIAQSGT